jgi:hypothetical protein
MVLAEAGYFLLSAAYGGISYPVKPSIVTCRGDPNHLSKPKFVRYRTGHRLRTTAMQQTCCPPGMRA